MSFLFLIIRRSPVSTLFPYTTLFRSDQGLDVAGAGAVDVGHDPARPDGERREADDQRQRHEDAQRLVLRSEEHTSELQSRRDLVCRLLLEKKNKENY